MNRILILILMLLPSIGLAQTQSKQSIGVQLITLGLSLNYERLLADNHSLALVYGRDMQIAGEWNLHQGNIFRLQYRLRIGDRAEEPHLRSGMIASAFVEHATNRLIGRDFGRAQFNRAAIGGLIGFRLMFGKRKQLGYEMLVGPKYLIPYFEVPEWYAPVGNRYPVQGFNFEGTVGIFFLLGTTNKSS
ncbi:MAG: hypothetical protein AB8H47_05115 [Bacteroidia bacterium]